MSERCAKQIMLVGALTSLTLLYGQETRPVGKTELDQGRNAELLSSYDHQKYPSGITGYTGMDRQRIAVLNWKPAIRSRIGPRGNYKAGLARLPNGKLLAAVCRRTELDPKRFEIHIYESDDEGISWSELATQPLPGKEPSLTALPDGSILLTAQNGYFGPEDKKDKVFVSRSQDGGRSWEMQAFPWDDYPRNLILEPNGAVLMIRALNPDWRKQGNGSPHLELARSRDGGKNWHFSEGIVDWNYTAFGEVSTIRLRDGRLLATLRRQIPGTGFMEGFQETVLTESRDGGKHWSTPRTISAAAEVHFYLTELMDGRILATYSHYHLPYGVFAILSRDGGKTWEHENPIQLALSADLFVGWPVTIEIEDREMVTAYAVTAYLKQPPNTTVCEVVKWALPD